MFRRGKRRKPEPEPSPYPPSYYHLLALNSQLENLHKMLEEDVGTAEGEGQPRAIVGAWQAAIRKLGEAVEKTDNALSLYMRQAGDS